MVEEQIDQRRFSQWFEEGRTIASGLEAEADALQERVRELRAWAKKVRKAIPSERRRRRQVSSPAPPAEEAA